MLHNSQKDFLKRHIGPSDEDQNKMLKELNYKSLDDLIREVYDIVGPFKFERSDLHITEELKQRIVSNCKNDVYKQFGEYTVKEVGTIDGFKYFFDENRWVMIRPSGTEPVLRTYAEAPTLEEVRKILQVTKETICN